MVFVAGKGQAKKSGAVTLVSGLLLGLVVAGMQFTLRSHRLPDSRGMDQTLANVGSQAMAALQDRVRTLEDQVERLKSEKAKLQGDVKHQNEQARSALERPATCIDRHKPWSPSPERDKEYPELAQLLKTVAINNEVMVAVSNKNYANPGGMLSVWMANAKKAEVRNAMVIALDDDTKTVAEKEQVPAFRMDLKIPESQKNAGSNHAVSGLKFRILKNFIKLGYAVLLSDVDIVTLQNPFAHLKRDCDVEGMSDGWDDGTAYGYNDVADDASMGWARYAHSMRIFVFNSGLFYLRPTQAALDLLDRVINRVETENGWDQALFNECIYFPFSPRNDKDPSVTRRVMDIRQFMNSKFLFKHLRHDAGAFASVKPVMVHVNYHPDKFERMLAVVKRYRDGDMHALDGFPDGSQ